MTLPSPSDRLTRIDLALLGFGHVGRRFAALLHERAAAIAAEGALCRVVGVSTARHGTAWHPDGLDLAEALRLVNAGSRLESIAATGVDGAGMLLDRAAGSSRAAGRPLVVIEATPLDIAAGQPAIDHVRSALDAGADVVSANKGPIAFAYRELAELAASRGRLLRFESAVMDGVPIFNLVRETMPAVHITGFRGIVNATTSHILSAMEAGRPFDDALAEMQAAGIAEADPSLDVDGWDAAAKTAALANVWMDVDLDPHRVQRTGIRDLDAGEVAAARRRRTPIRLVAAARRGPDGGVRARVEPVALDRADPLACLPGMANALEIETDLLGRIVVSQLDGGLTQTAYGLLSDLVSVARARRAAPGAAPRRSP